MKKILQFASLSLCATALAATANASRIDFVSAPSSAPTEFSSNSRTSEWSDNAFANLGAAASRQGLFDKHDLVFSAPQRGANRVSVAPDGNNARVPENATTLALIGFTTLSLVAMRRLFPN